MVRRIASDPSVPLLQGRIEADELRNIETPRERVEDRILFVALLASLAKGRDPRRVGMWVVWWLTHRGSDPFRTTEAPSRFTPV